MPTCPVTQNTGIPRDSCWSTEAAWFFWLKRCAGWQQINTVHERGQPLRARSEGHAFDPPTKGSSFANIDFLLAAPTVISFTSPFTKYKRVGIA